jgi:hypothetical protein
VVEAARISETVNFYETMQCYNPEDRHLPNKIFRKKESGFPSRAAECELEHVFALHMFTSTKGTFPAPPLNQ